jgi:hypothetical protein
MPMADFRLLRLTVFSQLIQWVRWIVVAATWWRQQGSLVSFFLLPD